MENFIASYGSWAFLIYPIVWALTHALAMPGEPVKFFGIGYTKKGDSESIDIGAAARKVRDVFSKVLDWVLRIMTGAITVYGVYVIFNGAFLVGLGCIAFGAFFFWTSLMPYFWEENQDDKRL